MPPNPSLLPRLVAVLKRVLVPTVGGLRKLSPSARTLFWVLHWFVVLAVAVGLYFLLRHFDFKLTRLPKFIGHFWASVLFLLLYAIVRVAYYLWTLWFEVATDAEYADIEAAWNAAVRAVELAGYDLADLPLFLVLGEPDCGESAFFQGTNFRQLMPRAPSSPAAPLHVYAAKDSRERPGLFVCCSGTSLLGRHSRLVSGKEVAEGLESADDPVFGTLRGNIEMTITPGVLAGLAAGAPGREVNARKLVNTLVNVTSRSLTGEEMNVMEDVLRPSVPAGRSVLRSPELVGYHTSRLRYLCHLIVRDRAPRCPANGILLLLPLASTGGTTRNQLALDTGVVCRADLATVCDVFQLHVPTFVLLCDLQKVSGFKEFLSDFTAEERRQNRIGQRVPLIPRFPGDNEGAGRVERVRKMLNSLATRVCGPVVLTWVYKRFNVEAATGQPDLAAVERHNGRLFQFFDSVHGHKDGLAVVLKEALTGADDPEGGRPTELPIRFGGLYLGWTGSSDAQQAFYAAVLERLYDEQKHVSWTQEVLEREEYYKGWTVWVNAFVFAVGVAIGTAVAYFFSSLGREK
jgi:hypothetical protein